MYPDQQQREIDHQFALHEARSARLGDLYEMHGGESTLGGAKALTGCCPDRQISPALPTFPSLLAQWEVEDAKREAIYREEAEAFNKRWGYCQ